MTPKDLGDTPFLQLKNLMTRLRKDCPWDNAQTFETIAPYTIEEAYEVSDAIVRQDYNDLKSELGDLLFQVLFHAKMAEEIQAFDLDDVAETLIQKMIDRHPHVFTEVASEHTAGQQKQVWEEIKAKERAQKMGTSVSVLDDVAITLPALMRAEKLQKRAARVGFDWPNLDGVLDKITEEAREVAEAADKNSPDDIEDEVGDLLFAVTNLARKLGVDPETALRRTNRKFTSRFQHIETVAKDSHTPLEQMSLEEMEVLWQSAKHLER